MINKIIGNSYETAQKKSLGTNYSKPSFGMAYHLNSSAWNKTFDAMSEKNFIAKVMQKVRNGDLSLISNDGINYKLKTSDGEILYSKETKGLMSNLKFIPNNASDTGFYIIDNSNPEISRDYKVLANLLDSTINRQKLQHKNSYNPQNIIPANMYNTKVATKGYDQTMYLRDTTPRGLRGIQLQEKMRRTSWPSETKNIPTTRTRVSDYMSLYA